MKQLITAIASTMTVLLFSYSQGYGQGRQLGGSTSDSKLTPGESLNATSMSGLYNPNLFDGTLNVSIPIYEYKVEDADYGISLSYNGRGQKIDEYSSNLGQGWQMQAFGKIQRVLKDLPDEIFTITDSLIYHQGPSALDSMEIVINPERTFKGKLSWFNDSPTQLADTTIYRDGESDDFIVSVGSLSFTFNIGKDGFTFKRPERNVRVELLLNGIGVTEVTNPSEMTNLEFRITDEQGNQYYFVGGDVINRQLTDKYGNGIGIGVFNYYANWMIKKIILASGAEIKYTYLPNPITPIEAYKRYTLTTMPNVYPNPHGELTDGASWLYANLDKIDYPNNVTAKIIYDNAGRLDFSGKAIREIQISQGGSSENMLRYKMQQAYFKTRTLGQINTDSLEVPYRSDSMGTSVYSYYRLKLNGIRLSSGNGQLEEPYYTFEYHNSIQFPHKLTGSIDFFGYYNGNIPHQHSGGVPIDRHATIPYHLRHFHNTQYVGVNRTPNADSMKLGMLTKIKNAFGGEVAFEYEGHDLVNVLKATSTPSIPENDPFYLGHEANDGLRIKSIIESDKYHPGSYRKTTFTFNDGQRFLNGGYFHYPIRLDGAQRVVDKVVMEGVYMTPHQFVNGSNHGYGTVNMFVRNETGQLLSKKRVTFTNFKDATSNNQPRYTLVGSGNHFYKYPYADKQVIRDWEIGLPITTTEFDQNESIVMETTNQYEFTLDSMSSKNKIENQKRARILWQYIPDRYKFFDSVDNYRPYRGKALLKQTVTKKYISDIAFVTDTLKYAYDGNYNLKSLSGRNSKGEEVMTIHYYNYDVITSAGGSSFNPLPGIEKIVSTQKWKRPSGYNPLPQGGILQEAFFNGYIAESNGSDHKKIRNRIVYNALFPSGRIDYNQYLGTGSFNTTALKSWGAFNGADLPGFEKSSEVMLYDSKGNSLETIAGTNGKYKSFLWDTVYNQKLAEALNARHKDIAYSSFENNYPGPGGLLEVTRGNISYDITQVFTGQPFGSISGKAVYRLSSSMGGQRIMGSENLTTGQEYVLSFWATGGLPKIYVGTAEITGIETVYIKDSWNQFHVRFIAPDAAKFRIEWPGTGTVYLDEVRLHPLEATMQNWTYEPLFGISSATDLSGRISYIEYDGLGRQRVSRDQDGNVTTKTEYQLQQ
jgi:hypothetical protein